MSERSINDLLKAKISLAFEDINQLENTLDSIKEKVSSINNKIDEDFKNNFEGFRKEIIENFGSTIENKFLEQIEDKFDESIDLSSNLFIKKINTCIEDIKKNNEIMFKSFKSFYIKSFIIFFIMILLMGSGFFIAYEKTLLYKEVSKKMYSINNSLLMEFTPEKQEELRKRFNLN